MTDQQAAEILWRATLAGDLDAGLMPELAPLAAAIGVPVRGAEEPIATLLCCRCDDAHPLLLLDNLIGDCAGCGCRVQYRVTVKTPPRRLLCLPCAVAELPPEVRRKYRRK